MVQIRKATPSRRSATEYVRSYKLYESKLDRKGNKMFLGQNEIRTLKI